jgi:hypothetical protein
MDLGGVAEVSSAEGCGLLLEVLPDALDLLPIRWVVGDDGVQAAVRGRHEVVGSSVGAEPVVHQCPQPHTVTGYR